MKNILAIAAIAFAGAASATTTTDWWFETTNAAGGKILLLSFDCRKRDGGKVVISTSRAGDNLHGCWYFFADHVHIVWEGGKTSSFQSNDFEYKKQGQQNQRGPAL